MNTSYILGCKTTGLAVHCSDLEKLKMTAEAFCLAAISKLDHPNVIDEAKCLLDLWDILVVTPMDDENIFNPVLESLPLGEVLVLWPPDETTDTWFISQREPS